MLLTKMCNGKGAKVRVKYRIAKMSKHPTEYKVANGHFCLHWDFNFGTVGQCHCYFLAYNGCV